MWAEGLCSSEVNKLEEGAVDKGLVNDFKPTIFFLFLQEQADMPPPRCKPPPHLRSTAYFCLLLSMLLSLTVKDAMTHVKSFVSVVFNVRNRV